MTIETKVKQKKIGRSFVTPLLAAWCIAAAGVIGWTRVNASPKLVLLEDTKDFGSVIAGTEVRHAFTVSNAGRKVLEIKRIQASCGCVSEARMSKYAILPGKDENLFITLKTPRYKASVSEKISFATNDPANPLKVVTVKARTNPNISIQPSVLNFGVVDESELPVTQEITIANLRPQNSLSKVSVQASNGLNTRLVRDSPGKWRLSVSLSKTTPLGPIAGSIRILPDWTEQRDLVALGQVVGDIYASPSNLLIRTGKNGAPASANVEIQSHGQSLQLLSCQVLPLSAQKWLACNLERQPSSRKTKTLKIRLRINSTKLNMAKSTDSAFLLAWIKPDGKAIQTLQIPVYLAHTVRKLKAFH